MEFKQEIRVRWSDIDHNQHVRHSAYYDYGAVIRIAFFNAIGFDMQRLSEAKLGPVLFKESCSFFAEIRIHELIVIDLKKGVISEDGSKWAFYHDLHREDGKLAAQIAVEGAWMDTEKRKITAPPREWLDQVLKLDEGKVLNYK